MEKVKVKKKTQKQKQSVKQQVKQSVVVKIGDQVKPKRKKRTIKKKQTQQEQDFQPRVIYQQVAPIPVGTYLDRPSVNVPDISQLIKNAVAQETQRSLDVRRQNMGITKEEDEAFIRRFVNPTSFLEQPAVGTSKPLTEQNLAEHNAYGKPSTTKEEDEERQSVISAIQKGDFLGTRPSTPATMFGGSQFQGSPVPVASTSSGRPAVKKEIEIQTEQRPLSVLGVVELRQINKELPPLYKITGADKNITESTRLTIVENFSRIPADIMIAARSKTNVI